MNFSNKSPVHKEKPIKKWFLKNLSRITRKVFGVDIKPLPATSEMLTLEQSVNIQHFIQQIITFKIPGEFVELGCFTGQSALQIQALIQESGNERIFHVYDKFDLKIDDIADIKGTLINNFEKANLKVPVIHTGDVEEIIPAELPHQLAFVHIDLTIGTNQKGLKKLITHCLQSIYPRLSKGGICVIMDYHDLKITIGGINQFPELKQVCDEFFSDKPEKISALYGGHYSHGYFRKM